MSQEVRVRFAPSPTGHVHIGNIRAAIFNWLYARNQGGKFLLRVEDTDKERSTPEAIDSLLDCMQWLGLDYDEEVFYQSSQADHHIAVAEKLISEGRAYKFKKGDGMVTLFRMPWDVENFSTIKEAGAAENVLHPEATVEINEGGITFALVSKKGKAVPQEQMCLAGYKDLKIFNEAGDCLLDLNEKIEDIYSGKEKVSLSGAVKMTFTRHLVGYSDLIKGDLTKPLDSMKDLVIVKSDGSPLFHLANICDDITQNMTHIIRGDDHVENTYRHIVIYEALGEKPAQYAHLPMIVNAQGRPYAKRDGDAFVGDFRSKGYLADALFNYLTLLGWSPGNDREKVSKEETIELFSLDRVKSTAAQMDMNKLYNMNGQYMEDLSDEAFFALASEFASKTDWYNGDDSFLKTISSHMKSRTKLVTQVDTWNYYFNEGVEQLEENAKDVRKTLQKEGMADNLKFVAKALESVDSFTAANIEEAIITASEECGAGKGRLNKPIRMAVTAMTGGAELFPTMEYIGKERVIARLNTAAERDCQAAD